LSVSCELLFVDDGSSDQTPTILRQLASRDQAVRAIRLSRCFGHQIALSAGIDHARGAAVLLFDADLQDPPELFGEMLAYWREGFDVVYGVRRRRAGEPWWRRIVTDVFYRVLRLLSPIHPPERAADFRLLGRRVVDELRRMPEPDRYLRGMVAWIGLRQTAVLYDRRPRVGGRRKYTLRKLARLAVDGIVSSGPNALRLVSLAGLGVALVVLIMCGAGALFWRSQVMLLASLIGLLGAFHFVFCLCLGEYVVRIYHAGLRRPMYIIEERFGGEQRAPPSISRPVEREAILSGPDL
jgi:dolichol-phosphate mannosyltransferase